MIPIILVLFDHVILVEKLYLKKIIAIQPAKTAQQFKTRVVPICRQGPCNRVCAIRANKTMQHFQRSN